MRSLEIIKNSVIQFATDEVTYAMMEESCEITESDEGMIVLESAEPEALHLIPLPGGKSKVWQYFGLYSRDGYRVAPDLSSNVYCMVPGCANPKIGYCNNTTNLYSHLERRHPGLALPEKRPVKTNQRHGQFPLNHSTFKKSVVKKYICFRKPKKVQEENTPEPSNHKAIKYNNEKSVLPVTEQYNTITVEDEEEEGNDLILDEQAEDGSPPFKIVCVNDSDSLALQTAQHCQTTQTKSTDDRLSSSTDTIVTEALFELMVDDMTGVELLQRPGFQRFLFKLYPHYNAPSMDVARAALQRQYDASKALLKEELLKVPSMAIALNFMGQKNEKRRIQISVSYIDCDWVRHLRVIGTLSFDDCPDETLEHIFSEYQLTSERIVAISANCLKPQIPFFILNTIDSIPLIICFETALDEALQAGFLAEDVEKFLKVFISPNITAQNENPNMKWLLIFEKISGVLENANDFNITVSGVNKVLRDLLNSINILEQDTSNNASVLIPILHQIQNLYLSANENAQVEAMTKEIRLKLDALYKDSNLVYFLEKSTLLDPRFKNVDIFSHKSELQNHILAELRFAFENVKHVTTKEPFENHLFKTLPKKVTSSEQKISSELQCYTNFHVADPQENPLHFWKKYEQCFPTLSVLAKKYLCVPLKSMKYSNPSSISRDDSDVLHFLASNKDIYNKSAKVRESDIEI